MTPEAFKAIRQRAGLSTANLAKRLRIAEARTIRRYEDGTRPVSGPVSLLMELMDTGEWK
jgi:DNA-binding transcriptional regulator YiaG